MEDTAKGSGRSYGRYSTDAPLGSPIGNVSTRHIAKTEMLQIVAKLCKQWNMRPSDPRFQYKLKQWILTHEDLNEKFKETYVKSVVDSRKLQEDNSAALKKYAKDEALYPDSPLPPKQEMVKSKLNRNLHTSMILKLRREWVKLPLGVPIKWLSLGCGKCRELFRALHNNEILEIIRARGLHFTGVDMIDPVPILRKDTLWETGNLFAQIAALNKQGFNIRFDPVVSSIQKFVFQSLDTAYDTIMLNHTVHTLVTNPLMLPILQSHCTGSILGITLDGDKLISRMRLSNAKLFYVKERFFQNGLPFVKVMTASENFAEPVSVSHLLPGSPEKVEGAVYASLYRSEPPRLDGNEEFYSVYSWPKVDITQTIDHTYTIAMLRSNAKIKAHLRIPRRIIALADMDSIMTGGWYMTPKADGEYCLLYGVGLHLYATFRDGLSYHIDYPLGLPSQMDFLLEAEFRGIRMREYLIGMFWINEVIHAGRDVISSVLQERYYTTKLCELHPYFAAKPYFSPAMVSAYNEFGDGPPELPFDGWVFKRFIPLGDRSERQVLYTKFVPTVDLQVKDGFVVAGPDEFMRRKTNFAVDGIWETDLRMIPVRMRLDKLTPTDNTEYYDLRSAVPADRVLAAYFQTSLVDRRAYVWNDKDIAWLDAVPWSVVRSGTFSIGTVSSDDFIGGTMRVISTYTDVGDFPTCS